MNTDEREKCVRAILSDIEIIDPITGEVLDRSDVDQLLASYVRIRDQSQRLYQAELLIREAVAAMASGTGKTLRVRGNQYRAKIEQADELWSQSLIKGFVADFPKFSKDWLRVATYAVNKAEWKKVLNEVGPEDFEKAKQALKAANQGVTGVPRIIIEEGANDDAGF